MDTATHRNRDRRGLTSAMGRPIAAGAAAVLLTGACVFGPEPAPVVHIDFPPTIETSGVRPNPDQESIVSFNLNAVERDRTFQATEVYDFNIGDHLTHAFVIQLGELTPISVPPANLPRHAMITSTNQDNPFFTRYESRPLRFDPCRFGEVSTGLVSYGTIQLVVYDEIPESQRVEAGITEYTTRWTWQLAFSGQCRSCSSNADCAPDERCVNNTCVAE